MPVYARDWWWDAACGASGWDACILTGDGESVLGALPFRLIRKRGLTLIQKPPLTAYQPLWVAPSASDRRHRRYAGEKKVVTDLLQKLPKAALVRWQLQPDWTNGLPFYWSGYDLNVRYTYRLKQLDDPDVLLERLEGSVRTNLRKTQGNFTVQPLDDVDVLWKLKERSYLQKQENVPLDRKVLHNLHEAIRANEAGQLYTIVDASGKVHAAAYLLWDERWAYYWLSALDPQVKSSGAATRLLWELICEASHKGLGFDFEGSMEAGIEQLFRAFEAERVPYLDVSKIQNRWLKMLYQVWR